MERVERENLRNEARRPVRKQYLYADSNQIHVNLAPNQAAAVREVEGPRIRLDVNPGHTDWRMVYRKPLEAIQEDIPQIPLDYYQQRERKIQKYVPEAMQAGFDPIMAPTKQNVPDWAAKELHQQRMANVVPTFVPKSPATPAEKKEKRRRRRDPLFTSVKYPGDNPRK